MLKKMPIKIGIGILLVLCFTVGASVLTDQFLTRCVACKKFGVLEKHRRSCPARHVYYECQPEQVHHHTECSLWQTPLSAEQEALAREIEKERAALERQNWTLLISAVAVLILGILTIGVITLRSIRIDPSAGTKQKRWGLLKAAGVGTLLGALISLMTIEIAFPNRGLWSALRDRCSACGKWNAERLHRSTFGPERRVHYTCQPEERARLFIQPLDQQTPPTDDR